MHEDNLNLKDQRKSQEKFTPGRILAITIFGIATAEVIAMMVLFFFQQWPYYLTVILDTAIMLVIIFPLIYFFSFRPLLQHMQQRYQTDHINQTRLRLMQYAQTHTMEELLQATLDEAEVLTNSTISYLHLVDKDQKTLWFQAWSTNTLQNICKSVSKSSHYNIDQAGVWANCIRQRKPIIHNDFNALTDRKGFPEGHARISREMAVPILRDNKIVAVLGVGNKLQNYTPDDVYIVSTVADFIWDIVDKKRAETALIESEEKFRTLVNWTYDWEKWLDPLGNIVYMSPSCERITGYTPEEFISDSDLLTRIVHPQDRQAYLDHQRIIHDESAGLMSIEYRIIDRSGNIHWLEHFCRPLFSADSRYLGRRISSRDITERRRIEEEMRLHDQKEALLNQTIRNIQTDIARDLHDTIGQNIGYLRMNLEYLRDSGINDREIVQAKIKNMTAAANEAYDLIRAMLSVLQTGNMTDPLQMFSRYANQVAERAGLQITLNSQGDPHDLSPFQIRQLFFIFREALNNIEKYAKASLVSVGFTWNRNGLSFSISDNGQGFNPDNVQPAGHYGLKFMRERTEMMNGSFNCVSSLSGGTTITIEVPSLENGNSQLS